MPRLKQAGREAANEYATRIFNIVFGDRDPVAEPGTATGTPGNWWTVFNILPDAFEHTTEGFRFYRSPKRLIDPKLRELGQIRAGYTVGSQFVFSQHCKACRHLGMPEEQIEAIPHWQVATCFSELERALLAYTDALVLERGRVPDGVFEVLKKHLSDEEILEFTYITCTYMMHAIMSRALRLEFDDVDERVVEVPAPEGYYDDVMSMVDKKED
ncbi:MAG TPA: carboxymuconolactone decarboxylase family protein [Hyphomonas sp.]|nr:carboxymuconolactone decarboxylase family protein [Hyphomonas sp.]MCA8904872.1 carboxymuconolactone decarboxylase family protein [Hyphomonas sp.]MCB9962583.1 carboxymuconolactone decarboxylase family protein [Hyphomonas sp.]MCB9971965.1 carboxymuconolactone decarboxylase family protein [Hyphomonas sp.]HPE47904.1 carboxymuconolactone decarboxylase family protein [Hyphomonas sp.]